MAPAVAMNRPGDPAGSEAGMVVASPTQPPPNSPNGQGPAKPLVDLTDNGNGGGPSDPESDLQRAIKLSLQVCLPLRLYVLCNPSFIRTHDLQHVKISSFNVPFPPIRTATCNHPLEEVTFPKKIRTSHEP